MDSEKVKAFMAEYRDLVHRHGLGLQAEGPQVVAECSDPDAHCAEIDEARKAARAAMAAAQRGHGEQSA